MRHRSALVFTIALALSGCQLDGTPEEGSGRQAIIGGDPDLEHPAVCGMKIVLPPDPQNPDAPREDRWCTCTLIEEQTVLTAAACVYENLDPEGEYDTDYVPDIELKFGQSFNDQNNQPIPVVDGVLHRYYDPDAGSRYNLAMLRLESAPGVQPVSLNERSLTDEDVGSELVLVGFGESTENMGDFGFRRVVPPTPITSVDRLFLFAGTEEATTCEGDSGGPGFLTVDGQERLATVNVLQTECFENAQRTRVDPYLDTFIYPYIDRFSGACPKDGNCDEQADCRSVDPDCDPCAWDGETCQEDCPTRDWDCPLGSFTGEACDVDGDCEEQGRCVEASDDPEFTYCASPCDPAAETDFCPADMDCTDADGAGECRYGVPSPGSQGWECTLASECRSGICEEGICAEECDPDGEPCPEPYDCLPSNEMPGADVCLGTIRSGGGGFCHAGGGAGGLALVILAYLGAALALLRRRRAA